MTGIVGKVLQELEKKLPKSVRAHCDPTCYFRLTTSSKSARTAKMKRVLAEMTKRQRISAHQARPRRIKRNICGKEKIEEKVKEDSVRGNEIKDSNWLDVADDLGDDKLSEEHHKLLKIGLHTLIH